MFCFLAKYSCVLFEFNCCFYTQLIFTLTPLVIAFILNLALLIIRVQCLNSYLILFEIDGFIKLNKFLIFINIFQLFIIAFIILFIFLIFFVSTEKIRDCIDFLICCKHCNCQEIKIFCASICAKEDKGDNENNKNNQNILNSSINISTVKIRNEEKPPDSEKRILKNDHNNLSNSPDIPIVKIKNEEKPPMELDVPVIKQKETKIDISIDINPKGPNCEMYLPDILLGQKILIVMAYYENSCNIDKLYENSENKTVKEAVSHYGIDIVTVNNYNDAIKEITKEENGKCPYYACWLINSDYIQDKVKLFLQLLIVFWKNGGAVVLFSDNEPFIKETNLFLSMIKAGFTMNGDYIGEKDIYGDDSGLLNAPALFNRKKDIYKYKSIQRQSLSHNLYNIYEGVTISSITKNNKRGMDVKLNEITPFIAFARDSEGGINSFIRLASNNGEGDIIVDGGFTKLFHMKEKGTFRYVQNIAGFTARPEVHISHNINPKYYRPKKVTLDDAKNIEKNYEFKMDEINESRKSDVSFSNSVPS